MIIYCSYESVGTLKSFSLFLTVKTKLNLGHSDKFEIKLKKSSCRGSRSQTPQNLATAHCCFAEHGKEMYQEL